MVAILSWPQCVNVPIMCSIYLLAIVLFFNMANKFLNLGKYDHYKSLDIFTFMSPKVPIDGTVQDFVKSITNALELLHSCAKSLVFSSGLLYILISFYLLVSQCARLWSSWGTRWARMRTPTGEWFCTSNGLQSRQKVNLVCWIFLRKANTAAYICTVRCRYNTVQYNLL